MTYPAESIHLIPKSWETDLLGKHVYSLEFSPDAQDDEAVICEKLQSILLKIDHPCMISCKIPSHQVKMARVLASHKFSLMECSLMLSNDLKSTIELDENVRVFKKEDLEAVVDIAGCSFSMSRFHMDESLTKSQANLTRSEWVRNGCLGRADCVYVAEIDGNVAGFVLIKNKKDKELKLAGLDLIAVHPDFRGKSMGRALTQAAIYYADSQNFDRLDVVTQSHNTLSVRMYEQCGFRLLDSAYSFHYHRA